MKQPTLEELADRTTVAGVAINANEQLRVEVIAPTSGQPHLDLRVYRRRATGIYLPLDRSIVFNAALLDPVQQALRITREHLRGRG